MNERLEIIAALSFDSTLQEIIRVIYSVPALNYCVLRSIEKETVICVSKDRLESLVGQGYSDTKAGGLFGLAETGVFRPLDLEKLTAENELSNLLVITEECGRIMKFSEVSADAEPDYPSWWEAPLPLALIFEGKIFINGAAGGLPIAKSLPHIKTKSLPVKQDEFFVTLKAGKQSHSVLFIHLDKRVYLIEDVTRDVETADDVVWWASVGKAFAAKLEGEGRAVFKEGDEPDGFEPEDDDLPCRWDGRDTGKLRIGRVTETKNAPVLQTLKAPRPPRKPRKK